MLDWIVCAAAWCAALAYMWRTRRGISWLPAWMHTDDCPCSNCNDYSTGDAT